jgi:hypothetical protein
MSTDAPTTLTWNTREEGEAMTLVGTLEEQAQTLERDAAAMRKLVDATRDLGEERVAALLALVVRNGNDVGNGNGHTQHESLVLTPSDPPEGLPRGREAIRLIVRERPGLWTLRDLRAEMKRRGWFTSNKGVDVAVTRLVASGEAMRVGKGRYEFSAPEDRMML